MSKGMDYEKLLGLTKISDCDGVVAVDAFTISHVNGED